MPLLFHGHLKIQFCFKQKLRAIYVTLHQQLFNYTVDHAKTLILICVYILL